MHLIKISAFSIFSVHIYKSSAIEFLAVKPAILMYLISSLDEFQDFTKEVGAHSYKLANNVERFY